MGNNTFANRLKTLREAAGLSERDLAKKLFVTRQAVSKWETGKGLPSPDILMNIANIFNVSTDYLLGMTDTPAPKAHDVVPKEQSAKSVDEEHTLSPIEELPSKIGKTVLYLRCLSAPIIFLMLVAFIIYDGVTHRSLSIISYVLLIPAAIMIIIAVPNIIKVYKTLRSQKNRSSSDAKNKSNKDNQ